MFTDFIDFIDFIDFFDFFDVFGPLAWPSPVESGWASGWFWVALEGPGVILGVPGGSWWLQVASGGPW